MAEVAAGHAIDGAGMDEERSWTFRVFASYGLHAIARQAGAERVRRAKVIHAEGGKQASSGTPG